MNKNRVLITGGMGFVASHFVEHFLKNTDWDLVLLDKLSYASNGFDRIRDINAFDDKRVTALATDFSLPLSDGVKKEIGKVDYIFHIGAESHVDNSITDPIPFVMSNVLGTVHMLNFARECGGLKCFFFFSTDECLGPAPEGINFKEDDVHRPSNPYAASKSAAEQFVFAYGNTYKIPWVITRSMNIIGERQHPEKFVPLCINKIRAGEQITIHGDRSCTKAGSRFYIHGRNVADGYLFLIDLLENGHREILNQSYHITGEREVSNSELAILIGEILQLPVNYKIVDFHSSRPGHDTRYALDGTKMASLGWAPPKTFEQSLEKTVKWFVDPENKKWLEI